MGNLIVSIPQAVSTVATGELPVGKAAKLLTVSIPQAVSTVATEQEVLKVMAFTHGFNTASGKYCCNEYYV